MGRRIARAPDFDRLPSVRWAKAVVLREVGRAIDEGDADVAHRFFRVAQGAELSKRGEAVRVERIVAARLPTIRSNGDARCAVAALLRYLAFFVDEGFLFEVTDADVACVLRKNYGARRVAAHLRARRDAPHVEQPSARTVRLKMNGSRSACVRARQRSSKRV